MLSTSAVVTLQFDILRQTKTYRGSGRGGPDPAFPPLFRENPASRTFFIRFPESRFSFPQKYIKKSNFYKS